MDIEKLIEQLHIAGAGNPGNIFDVAATALQYLSEGADEVNAALQEQIAENEKLRAKLCQVKEKNAKCGGHCESTAKKLELNGRNPPEFMPCARLARPSRWQPCASGSWTSKRRKPHDFSCLRCSLV